jgi:hypothetical protein
VLYPKIESLVAKKGDKVRIRLANVMMNSHPIHLHGHEFVVTRRGAKRLPESAQYTENTISVAPGETRDIEFIADNPGDWAFHCHKSHHTMNQMQHDLPNLTGISKGNIEKRIRQFFPEFMGLMNINGMGDMFEMYGTSKMEMNERVRLPENISPIGNPGPFGVIELGGMFTLLKVREGLTSYIDPGWYQHPPGTVAESINANHENNNHAHHHDMSSMQKQTETVSWFSRKEENKEPKNIENANWMQSNSEDCIEGHMHHKSNSSFM